MLGRSARLVGMRMASSAIQTRRWSRTKYDRMLELGVIRPGKRVQLIDRSRKASLYAKAGIGEYCVVTLAATRVEVSRDPTLPSGAPTRYHSIQRLAPGDQVAPITIPHASIAIADLLL